MVRARGSDTTKYAPGTGNGEIGGESASFDQRAVLRCRYTLFDTHSAGVRTHG